ncbi:MAG: hypothetical protein HUU37_06965, partial [Bdellovibrionales bacterium]|nr:hypothetical protein [Bdellovibrionales bacterium]
MNLFFRATLLVGLILPLSLPAKPGVYQCHGNKEQKWSATVDKLASKITIRFADPPPLEVPVHRFEGGSGGFDASGSNKKQRVSVSASLESCELDGAAYPYSVVITRNAQELVGCCGFGERRSVPPRRPAPRDSDRTAEPRDSEHGTDDASRTSTREADPRDSDRSTDDASRTEHRFVEPRDSSRSAD